VLDISHWDVVPLNMRHLLIVEGRINSLLPQRVDIERYVKDLAELYVEVVERLRKASDLPVSMRCIGKKTMIELLTWSADVEGVDVMALMETKTWLEKVLKILSNGETFSGRGRLTVENSSVYLEGIYSPGHTYLYKIGVLRL
jgi:hypothetical protein